MPETLYIGDQIKVIFAWQDFAELVENSLGRDAVLYLERQLIDAFHDGYEDGHMRGYEAGYTDGYCDR